MPARTKKNSASTENINDTSEKNCHDLSLQNMNLSIFHNITENMLFDNDVNQTKIINMYELDKNSISMDNAIHELINKRLHPHNIKLYVSTHNYISNMLKCNARNNNRLLKTSSCLKYLTMYTNTNIIINVTARIENDGTIYISIKFNIDGVSFGFRHDTRRGYNYDKDYETTEKTHFNKAKHYINPNIYIDYLSYCTHDEQISLLRHENKSDELIKLNNIKDKTIAELTEKIKQQENKISNSSLSACDDIDTERIIKNYDVYTNNHDDTFTFNYNDSINGNIMLIGDKIQICVSQNAPEYKLFKRTYTRESFNVPNMFDINTIHEMMRECVSHNNENKHMKIILCENEIKLLFHIEYNKCMKYVFDVTIEQILVEHEDLIKKISDMQNEIVTLKKNNEMTNTEYNNACDEDETIVTFIGFDYNEHERADNSKYEPNINHKFKKYTTHDTSLLLYYYPNINNHDIKFSFEPFKTHTFKNLLSIDLYFKKNPHAENNDKCYEPIAQCKKLKHFGCMIPTQPKFSSAKMDDINIKMTNLKFLTNLLNLETINIHNVNSLDNIDDIYDLPKLIHVYVNAKKIIIEEKFAAKLTVINNETAYKKS